jgi:pantoate--beta-alanine ligase
MRPLESIASVRAHLAEHRRTATVIGLVPTMGALHRGHVRLIETARRECQIVVVSIFVNPLQFERDDDLQRYPRTLDADLELCGQLGVNAVFAPTAAEMYPGEPACLVEVHRLADHLCGRFRPGHFRGVATVVMKLLQIVQPERAYFGEKDAQQLAIIRRLVSDLNVPVTIVAVPTVREPDGLALSSRNQHLTADQRREATALFRALVEAERLIDAGACNPEDVKRGASALIPNTETIRLEYLEIVDPQELQPVTRITGPVLVAGAIWMGGTRLIDNILCERSAGPT